MNGSTSGRKDLTSRLRRGVASKAIAVAIGAATLVTAAGVGPAVAATAPRLWGWTGQAQARFAVICQGNTSIGGVDVRIPGSIIFGINPTPGYGNDWSWVRYRYRLVSYVAGTYGPTFAQTTYSGFFQAWDNLSPSIPVFTMHSSRMSFVVQVDIEWWNSTAPVGGATLQYGTYYASYGVLNAPAGGC